MGRDQNETGGRKPKTRRSEGTAPDFWSWHPTEAQKQQFEVWRGEQEDLGLLLEDVTKLGIVLTITRTKTGDGSCVVARNRFDSYGEGQALSVFNACPERCLWGMMFVLTVLHPHWPSQAVTTLQRAIDW